MHRLSSSSGTVLPTIRVVNKDYLMPLAEVEQSLRRHVSAADMPNLKELSTALAQHFQSGAVGGHRGWYMRPTE